VRIVWPKFSIRRIGDIYTHSPTARIAARASASSNRSLMTGNHVDEEIQDVPAMSG
jgi:hypothetical protein